MIKHWKFSASLAALLLAGGIYAAFGAGATNVITTLTGTELVPIDSGTLASDTAVSTIATYASGHLGNTTVTGTLHVTGAATLDSTLAAGASALGATTATTIDGPLGSVTPAAITGTTGSFSSTLGITGITTVTGGLAGPAATSPRNINTCGAPAIATAQGTDTANAANTDTYVAEVFVPANISTTGAALFNGTTQNGNVTLYLANSAGTQIAHTASTATSGATAYQLIAWVGGPIAVVGPGTYYMYFQNSATSNSWRTFPVGHCATSLHTGDTYGTFPTITPVATFTTNTGPYGGLY